MIVLVVISFAIIFGLGIAIGYAIGAALDRPEHHDSWTYRDRH